jgi:hypothetical protein
MSRTIEQRSEGGNFDCLVLDQVPELFTDGVSELQLGTPFSRILFHAVTQPATDAAVEQRVAKLSLVIPTVSLLELIANITEATTPETVTASEAAALGYAQHISKQLNRLAKLSPDSKSDK